MLVFNAIKAKCEEKNISIMRLEKETGIANGVVSRWNQSSPTVENLKKVADYLGTTVDALLEDGKEEG